MDFAAAFAKITGAAEPFHWQGRLFERFCDPGRDLPAALDLPTGLGKTSVMAIWYLARKAGATLPRRLVYVVDRRAVVDQATEEAEKIRAYAKKQAEDLPISTLRGQHADNHAWLKDPAGKAIIVGTVDMIGSRLLFEGYGVSRNMRPYHAGLLGADTLVVLDESHLVPPFEALLAQVQSGDGLGPTTDEDRAVIPRFRLLPLSATGGGKKGDVFRLLDEDREDAPVRQRLNATKRLRFESLDEMKLEDRLAEGAWELCSQGERPARILVYCNSREVAEKTKTAIENKAKGSKKEDIPAVEIERPELLVGARRVKEREDAKERLDRLDFFSRKDKPPPDKPAFVVATSAGEVGIDLDADHMVMDLVPFERLVQRLGRVNRLGEKDSQIVVIEEADKNLPDDLKARAAKAASLLRKLETDGAYQAGPGALLALKDAHGDAVEAASTPAPLYPALTRPLVDAWSMTSLKEHTGRPELQPWLRGWETDDRPQTTLVWRTHLPVWIRGGDTTPADIDDFFAAAPPHLAEKLETDTGRIHKWLLDRAEKLAATFEQDRLAAEIAEPENVNPKDTPTPPLGVQKIVAILLGRRGEQAKVYTAEYLVRAKQNKRDKDALENELKNRTLILDARIGGLTADGLFDPKAMADVPCADAEDGWLVADKEEPEKTEPMVPFRVRRVKVKRESEEGKTASQDKPAKTAETDDTADDNQWRAIHAFDAVRTPEGEAEWRLMVEKWHEAEMNEDGRSVTRKEQSLKDHQEWAEKAATEIVGGLNLPNDIAKAIILAARFHDEGKRAPVWQRAFSAPRDGEIYAKTKGPFRGAKYLGGYRHEFGSLLEIEKSNEKKTELAAFSEEMQDLILHLIAAHHGRARPVISTAGCDQAPPTALEARARDVALRFARLQKRFGPWGLAWLEALMRAADQKASRTLEEKGRSKEGGDG